MDPISALGGDSDPLVSSDEIEGWRSQTLAAFEAHILAGDHFFVQQSEPEFMQILSGVVDSAMTASVAGGTRGR